MKIPHILSRRERTSIVWRNDRGAWIFKIQPKTLTDNEIHALEIMYPSGYVPYAERVDAETIQMAYVESGPVTDASAFMAHYEPLLDAMRQAGLRHGDLTEYSVLVQGNKPLVIDWAESRVWTDPRPDKRPEGDRHWLRVTMEKLCQVGT